jgi:hypothetical protein
MVNDWLPCPARKVNATGFAMFAFLSFPPVNCEIGGQSAIFWPVCQVRRESSYSHLLLPFGGYIRFDGNLSTISSSPSRARNPGVSSFSFSGPECLLGSFVPKASSSSLQSISDISGVGTLGWLTPLTDLTGAAGVARVADVSRAPDVAGSADLTGAAVLGRGASASFLARRSLGESRELGVDAVGTVTLEAGASSLGAMVDSAILLVSCC